MDITPQTHVAEIVTHNPAATRIFARYGIDFCCGGKRPLGEVCAERSLDYGRILSEIASATPSEAEEQDWSEEPLEAIVNHILSRYHDRLRLDLPQLTAMADKVANVHGEKLPEVLAPLASRVRELRAELESHMMKEEWVLFPYVVALERALNEGKAAPQPPFGSVEGPIAAMEAEHDDAGRLLSDMRRLSRGYQLPDWACNTFRGLFFGLDQLEKDLHLHIHLENNVLFPRAAELERRAAAA